MTGDYAFQVYWEDNWGKSYYSGIMYNEKEADNFADKRTLAGMRESRVLVLEL